MTRFYTGKIAPSSKAYDYWVDTNENPYGGVIKYFNGSEWIYINDILVEKDKELQNKITEIQNTLKTKADKATTLAGYGITDAYTKTLADSKVTEAIGELVGTAPDALDTLYELAEALNNDEDFAATVTNLLGTKVDSSTYNTDKATFATKTELNNKVDKVNGKQLSTNDFTTAYKNQLDELATKEDAPSDGKTYGRKNGAWTEVKTDISKEDLLEYLLSYGVEWDITIPDPDLTRIGNPLLHKSLPVQSALKGCVAKGGAIKYYLDPNDWSKKEDGTASVLDGTDGSVRVHVPRFYGKSEIDGNKRRVRISTTQIDSSYTEIPLMLIDAYRATVDTTEGNDKAKMVSVVNTTAQFRGGTNNSSYDQYLDTDVFRTMLGKPRTNINRATARTYARNANAEVLNYEYYKWVLFWLPVIEYATFNIQQPFNNQLTADGYHQGGLGNGVTNIDGNLNNVIFDSQPKTPCGYANELGNFTGVKDLALPQYEYTPTLTESMTQWTNISNGTGTKAETINITNVTSTTGNLTYTSWDKITGTVKYNVTGLAEGQSIIFFTNNQAVATATADGDIEVNWGNTISNRNIRAGFTGECNITISFVEGTPATITFAAKTFSVARYRGFENIFGDVWTNLEGVIINIDSTQHPNDSISDVFSTTNSDNYGDDTAALAKMKYVGSQVSTNGFIKEFDLSTNAEIIPSVTTGASQNTYMCDYSYTTQSKNTLRTLIVGGGAAAGGFAGLGYFYSYYGVGNAAADFGFRTYSLV